MTKILLAGATGLVGRAALALLLSDERVTRVVAPTRRAIAAHPKLLNPIMDSTNLSPDAEWWAVDGAISAIGTTRAQSPSPAVYRSIDYDYALAIATQVRAHGANRFALTSSMGANARSRFQYTRTKGELENAIIALGFGSFTIVRPGVLDGERHGARPMEGIMGRVVRMAGPILPAIARVSPAATVAALLVEAASGGGTGTHIITSADIAVAARGLR